MTPTLQGIRQAVSKAQSARLYLAGNIGARESKIAQVVEETQAFEDVQRLIQETAQEVQESLRFQIQDIAQFALDAIFPDVYKFTVEFTVSRGRTDARLLLEKGGNVMDDILDSEGGTIAQIIAMALRIAVWTLAPTDNVIIMDEPGSQVSKEYRPIFAELIRGLSEHLKIQMIIVSHDPVMIEAADRTFLVTQGADGRSQVTYEDRDV